MLPQGWASTTFGECQGRTSSIDPRAHESETFDLFSVPSYSDGQPEVVKGGKIGSTKQVVIAGDVLLCKIVPHIRRGWVVPDAKGRRQIASGEWIVLRDHGLESNYLRRFILSDSFHEQFMQTVSGVGGSLMRARPAEAGKIAVPVPPLVEQRRIVEKLDALTALLARARAELGQVSPLVRRIRQSTLKAAFNGQLTAMWRSENGDVPWATKSIEEIALEGPSNGWSPPSGPDAQGAFTLKLTATTSGYLRLDESAVKRIYEQPLPSSRYWLQKGDLLIQRANSLEHVGASAIFDGPNHKFIYPDLMMRIRIADDSLRQLLWYFLNWEQTRRYFRERATGTAGNMPKISGAVLRTLRIPVPSRAERIELLAKINAAYSRAYRLETEAAHAHELLDRMEAAFLSKAFQGELVPQNPADEPASVLLERIRVQRTSERSRRTAMQLSAI